MESLQCKSLLGTLLFILTFSLTSIGQEIPIDIVDRINAVDYIFEGEVIKSTPYKSANGRRVYTSNTIKISKILKGNLTCGTIELITDGGIVDDLWVDRSHSLKLRKQCKGIFLATHTGKELSSVDFYSENNNQKLEATFQNQSFVKYWHNGIDWKVSDVWANYDSLAQIYNLAEVITGLNFVDCSVPSIFGTGNEDMEPEVIEEEVTMPTYDPADFDNLMAYIQHKKEHYSRSDRSAAAEKVFYNMENLIITGTTTKFLEFDVTIKDNYGNGYLDISSVRIVYDPAVFGSNIVTNSNIEVTRGDINSDTNCYSTPSVSDLSPNAFFAVAAETVYSQCKALVTTTPQKLMHFKMRILNCAIPSNIALIDTATAFDPSLVLAFSDYADFPADTFSTAYDQLEHAQTESVPSCVPTITSFTPTTVAGGIGDILEIRGFQFGATRGSGTVFFKNANDGGNSEVACDAADFLAFNSWSDTLIQLYMPSVDTAIIQSVAIPNSPAGTGYFRVVTNAGIDAVSPAPVTVSYSVVGHPTSAPKRPAYLGPNPDQNGQFIFHIDSLVAAYQNGAMVPIIKKALHEWTCLTGIDWILDSDMIFTQQPPVQFDSICVIRFGNLGANISGATQLALATSQRRWCPPNFYTVESDIEISDDPNISWFLDTIPTNPIPAGQQDLYFALLHELGHAHNLQHLISPNDIMHFEDNTGGAFRKVELYFDQPAYDGGNWVMDKSFQFPPSVTGCNLSTISSISSPLCSIIFGVRESQESSSLIIQPNPFNQIFTVSSEKYKIQSMVIIDITGKIVRSESNVRTQHLTVDMGQINNGMYLLKITLDNGVVEASRIMKTN